MEKAGYIKVKKEIISVEISHLYSLMTLKRTFNTDNLEEIVPVTISLDPNKYMPYGAPGITLKDSLMNTKLIGRRVPVLFPFPPKQGINPGVYTEICSENIYPLPQKNLIAGHKVKTVNSFNIDKMHRIRDYVRENNAITFVLCDLREAADLFQNIPIILSKYKYSTLFNQYGGVSPKGARKPVGEFITFASFVDINYCIPIFDHRKVDGMGVYCGFMYHNGNNTFSYTTNSMCFVLSNYGENLFYTDGASIATRTEINTGVLEYMLQRIKCEIDAERMQKTKSGTDKIGKTKTNKKGAPIQKSDKEIAGSFLDVVKKNHMASNCSVDTGTITNVNVNSNSTAAYGGSYN